MISIVLLAIGAVLIITEVVIGVETGFDLLLIGMSLFFGGILGYYTNDYYGIALATVLSVSYIVLGRKYVKNKVQAYTHTSNVDTLLGQILVVNSFDPAKKAGTTTVKSEDWRITSEQILNKGDKVVVKSIDGVSLIVEPYIPSEEEK